MALVNVSAKIRNPQQVTRLVGARAAPVIRRRLDNLGRIMVEEANKEIRRLYRIDRPFERRRHPGSRRLINAISYQVVGEQFPMKVTFRALGGKPVLDRVYSLNGDRRAYTMVPTGNWPLTGVKKPVSDTTRFRRFTAPGAPPKTLSWNDPGNRNAGRNGWVHYTRMDVKARPGDRFLETARNRAVQKWVAQQR